MPLPCLLDLTDPAAMDRSRAGGKAAVLASLAQAGLPVPDGSVIVAEAAPASAGGGVAAAAAVELERVRPALEEISRRYGDAPLAVRSSGVVEDLPGASFAGLYETVLDVRGADALRAAVQRCWASGDAPGVRAYQERCGVAGERSLAVLVQRLIAPDVSGVALGADPISGERGTVIVSAVAGNAASLVSGEAVAEDWEVRGEQARCRTPRGAVLTSERALSVARMLRRAEQLLGGPQDMEWAIAGEQFWILQARPMTWLPPAASWQAPLRGGWFRHMRLGEWLPEPITPLFESWLLERMEARFRERQARDGGVVTPPPSHVTVNGWYFHSPIGSGRGAVLVSGLIRRPRLALATAVGTRRPALADRLFFAARRKRWRPDVLLPYQQQVAVAAERAAILPPAELTTVVDGLADAAGEFLWSLVLFGGAAWRAETALARFHRRRLGAQVVEPYQVLLAGLADHVTPEHAVHSLDWLRETLGELSPGHGGAPPAAGPRREAAAAREAAELACRQALSGRPRRQARFATLLAAAREQAAARQGHALWFTLPWPVLRRCVLRLGEHLHTLGCLSDPGEVFFITRAELDACLASTPAPDLADRTRERRAEWQRQRRLSPPPFLGRPAFLLSRLLASPEFAQAPLPSATNALRGIPVSPGRATGPVRVLHDPSDAGRVRPGDVLVVATAAPALTPLFDKVAALCAVNGGVAVHVSLIAREFGIPSVMGLGEAAGALVDECVVTVDGNTGLVEIH